MASQDQNKLQGSPPSYHASVSSYHNYRPTETGGPNLPPYHNWQEAVPDTTDFPPPPVTGYFYSGTGNASSADAERAHEFCDGFPLYSPANPPATVYSSVQRCDIHPVKPEGFCGEISTISKGRWKGFTRDRSRDCSISTNLPLFFSLADSPWVTKKSKTVYFEVKLLGLRTGPETGSVDSSGLSIGFVAQPYPTWRSPGWERGSVGVFSDDGCRFVNDSWGGKGFTTAFKLGETVGLGMTFRLPEDIKKVPESEGERIRVEIFFTRDGRKVGGWDLHEEVDAEAGGVEGLEGDFDLYGAIGLFGGVDFEACFDHLGWLWNPLL
ncbi:SSH4 family protein [Aspergillus tanneri]|uniref:SPRY domain-containing protein n=1 Tax=Aspergillus tanneri TaxID=1220188 RepID=A0A5M9MJH7_9EURO|nr:uncharacterized protein ATNIH1004_006963 [Aspergillus tanneri]KAA8645544.1 hypothetical protein ATNIH1004_006963 [Aspergillus tanneri]